MIESPRKRILADIAHQQPQEKTTIGSKISIQKLNSFNKAFYLKKTHPYHTQINKYLTHKNYQTIHQSPNDFESLNNMMKVKKICQSNLFFQDSYRNRGESCRSKSKINKDIENSIQYIQNIKNNNHNLFVGSTQKRCVTSQKNKKQNIMQAIGLQLPQITHSKHGEQKFLTQTIDVHQANKKYEKIGLYSYLQRDFIEKKKQQLTETKIIDYAKNPNNQHFHKKMLEKSRKFLKESAQNKYREMQQVKTIVQEQSKKFIQQQLQRKKQIYKKDYTVRNNVPYFSFLSLSEKEKRAVLLSIRKKKSVN